MGQYVRAIAADGTPTCDADANSGGTVTSVTAGSGLSGGSITLSGTIAIAPGGIASSMIASGAVGVSQINTTEVQARVSGVCAAGSSVRVVNADGTVTCQSDSNSGGTVTSVTAGSGLSGGAITSSGTVAVATGGITSAMIASGAVGSDQINTAQVQARLASCAAGSSIRAVNADGTVTCQIGGAGTVTSVAAGSGLSGGTITGTGTIAVATGGIVSGMIADGAVGAAQIKASEVQTRLASMCPAGQALRGVNADGSVICEIVNAFPHTVTLWWGADTDFPNIAVPADGLPIVGFKDGSPARLRVAKCLDPACTGFSSSTVVDGSAKVGFYLSLALGADGFPVMSYEDQNTNNGTLKVAKCGNAACTGTSTITTVDSSQVGEYTSIAIGTDGFPVISYRGNTVSGGLKVAKCVNAGLHWDEYDHGR